MAGTFAYIPAAGTVLATGTHTLTATFTPADTTRYNTATASTVLVVNAPAPAPKTTPTLSWPAPAAITQGTALSATQLNASASVAGTFAYSPAAGTVLAAGSHTLTASFTPSDSTRYTTAAASTSITVSAGVYQLTVSRPGGGTVNGAGINCGTAGNSCSVTMPAPMTIGLQVVSDAGYKFSGWTGDCAGTSTSITLQLNGQKSCGATFAAVSSTPPPTPRRRVTPTDPSALPIGAPYTLTFQQPSGGVVRAAGINCGTKSKACAVTMPAPMAIGIQATADPGYTFLAWTGHCSGNGPNLSLALEGPRSCGASFIPAGSTVIEPPPSLGPLDNHPASRRLPPDGRALHADCHPSDGRPGQCRRHRLRHEGQAVLGDDASAAVAGDPGHPRRRVHVHGLDWKLQRNPAWLLPGPGWSAHV